MANVSDSESTFRILVATDNHIGFAEKDGLRGQDTLRSFEEILRLAVLHKVDFILIAGDLFHESRPSLKSMHEVIRLLRLYCHGAKPVQFELLSEPKTAFSNTAFSLPNYLDNNINIGLPVFIIHGNHDDPSGPGGLCAVDVLHSAGLVNLFGKYASVERIDVNPIMLRKGNTRLALYGLGAVREERLHRLFLNNGVTFYRPSEMEDKWFSLCVVHQNRSRHGPTSYLPEHFLPEFLDLVVWGHEHECRAEPEWNSTQNFYVLQPGSSVATSLSEGESHNKAIVLLELRGKEFKTTKIPLHTVRPFYYHDLILQDQTPKLDPNALDVGKKIEQLCCQYIESAINSATTNSIEAFDQQTSRQTALHQINSLELSFNVDRLLPPSEPLIRLRIDLSGGYESFSTLRFGQTFVGRVANPKDLISFNRNREKLAAAQITRAEASGLKSNSEDNETEIDTKKVGLDSAEVEELVRQYLVQMIQLKSRGMTDESRFGLNLFTTFELEKGVRQYVDRGLSDAIQTVSNSVLTKTLRHLRIRKVPEERVHADILSFCLTRTSKSMNNEHSEGEDKEDDLDMIKNNIQTKTTTGEKFDWSLYEDSEEDKPKMSTKTMNHKTRRKRQNLTVDEYSEDESNTLADLVEDDSDTNSFELQPVVKKRTTRCAKPTRAASVSTRAKRRKLT